MHTTAALRKAAGSASYTLASGAQIPKLGFGTWKLKKDETAAAVSMALKAGFRHIDSAWAYKNEEATGHAIKQSGIDRKDIFLTSKLWNSFHGDNVEMGLDATLRDLGTDYLDLYLMHWPVAFANPKSSELASLKSQDGKPIENHILSSDLISTWKNLEQMVKKGKVRNIGISNHNIRRVDLLLQEAEIAPVVNQVEVNWGVPNDELLHYCEAHGVRLQAYSPLGSSDYVEEYSQDPVIQDVAARNNMTPTQVMLAWHFARGINPITRSRQESRLREALETLDKELPYADVQHLTKEAENKPITRVVDPREAWNVKEDIFEDGIDQTRLGALKTDSIEVHLPHEAQSSSGPSPYLEPRNDPSTENKPSETIARFHSFAGNRTSGTKGSTVLQQLMSKRRFSSSARAAATGSSSSAAPSFLASTSKQSLATPGLKFTAGPVTEARETRKMNMCTVRSSPSSIRHASTSAVPSASSLDASILAGAGMPASSSSSSSTASKRVFPVRKAFLYSQYTRLLSESQFMLLVQPNNLSVAELSKVREELRAVPLPEGAPEGSRARLTVVRAGVLKPVLREVASSGKASLANLESVLSGPLAMLTSPSLSPEYIARLLSVIDKALGNRSLPAKASAGQPHAKTSNANPRLVPLAAIIEGNKVIDVPALRDVSKLPSLQTLRAQLIGLLSAPASQLASILSMASGAQLAMTLEARKRQLEEGETKA